MKEEVGNTCTIASKLFKHLNILISYMVMDLGLVINLASYAPRLPFPCCPQA